MSLFYGLSRYQSLEKFLIVVRRYPLCLLHHAIDFQFDCFNTFESVIVNNFHGYCMHTCMKRVCYLARLVENFRRLKSLFLIVVEIPSVKFDACFAVSFCRKLDCRASLCIPGHLLLRERDRRFCCHRDNFIYRNKFDDDVFL